MRSIRHFMAATCCAAVGGVLAGVSAHADRVVPGPGEGLKVDQIIILSDVTGSTGKDGVFELEKQLVNDFVATMPDMVYQSGFRSFAGGTEDEEEWAYVRLRHGNLNEMTRAVAAYEYLGLSTPLRRGVEVAGSEFSPRAGRSALVVFSDGKSKPHQAILDQCAALNDGQNGQLCIYTINVGSSEEGRSLLEQMARVTGCGQAWQAADVQTPEGMEAMVRAIFFGQAQRTVVLSAEVLFDFDKAVLKPEGKEAVNVLIHDMNRNPNERVTVEGHTCDLGSDSYNLGLSQRRANAVKAYMVNQGIARDRISTEGYGESRPAVPNTSESNRKLNRRAEFRFTAIR